MRISYSALETFTTCPAQYKFQYIDRIKVPKSKEAVFGSLIHETLRMFHEPTRPTPPSEEELLKYFTDKWDPSVYQDPQEEAFAFHQGIEILKNYYLQNQGLKFNIVNLETPFEAPILDGQELHQITGKIDRIDKLDDGTFEVIDYKTAKKMPAQEQVDKNLQLSVYHLGLTNRWPSLQQENKPVKLTLYFLKHGERLSTTRTNQQLNETKERILSIIEAIKKSSFEPKPNVLCDWCQYQPYCPMYKHKFNKQKTVDEEQIKSIIQEYFEIKSRQEQDTKRMAELKEAINQYCDQQGIDRIFGEHGYITRLPQKRFEYDAAKLKEVLEPLGKWDEILTIDTAKFKKIIEQLPYDLRKKIDQAKKLEKEFKVITASKARS
jgi:RecB family exonuclease